MCEKRPSQILRLTSVTTESIRRRALEILRDLGMSEGAIAAYFRRFEGGAAENAYAYAPTTRRKATMAGRGRSGV